MRSRAWGLKGGRISSGSTLGAPLDPSSVIRAVRLADQTAWLLSVQGVKGLGRFLLSR